MRERDWQNNYEIIESILRCEIKFLGRVTKHNKYSTKRLFSHFKLSLQWIEQNVGQMVTCNHTSYYVIAHAIVLESRTGGGGSLSRFTNLKIDASRIFQFYFEAFHVSREVCASRITKNIFLKSRFSVNEMI